MFKIYCHELHKFTRIEKLQLSFPTPRFFDLKKK